MSVGRRPEVHSNDHAAAIYQRGLAALDTGRCLDAIELLSRIADSNSLPATLAKFYLGHAHLQQGLIELEAGWYADATRHLHAARRINPDSAALSRYLVTCHAGLGRFDLAAAEAERDRASGPPGGPLPIRLAHAFARDGQTHRAIETLRTAMALEPQRADLRFQLGVMHASIEDYSSAVTEFESAARLSPQDATIAQHLGLAHAALGQHAAAAECLMAAHRLAPPDSYIALLLAMAGAAASGQRISVADVSRHNPPVTRDDQAIAALGDAIIREPDFVEAFLSLPESDMDREIFAMLADTLRRALERHPDYADLHHHCSRVYERLGRTDAAIDEARRAVRINPRYVQALITLGRLYSRTPLTGEAIERLQAAIEAGGDYPDVHFMLGELYRSQGKRADAEGQYRRALELNSNYPAAREALEAVAIA